jgi:hypothetical protein
MWLLAVLVHALVPAHVTAAEEPTLTAVVSEEPVDESEDCTLVLAILDGMRNHPLFDKVGCCVRPSSQFSPDGVRFEHPKHFETLLANSTLRTSLQHVDGGKSAADAAGLRLLSLHGTSPR